MSHESADAPPVQLDLPIVQRLIEEHGDEVISYETEKEVHEGTVRHAFEMCGDLSYIGEQSEDALRAIILDAIDQTRAKRAREES